MLDDKKLNEMSERIDKHLSTLSKEDIEKLFPPDTRPLGWVSLETKEHLPQCLARDFLNGGTPIVVKTAEGKMYLTHVGDPLMWYYDVKHFGATHYFNGTDIEKQPYIVEFEQVIVETRMYNPEYGDDRICECGHSYDRHFDSYEQMSPVGCKYCECHDFIEKVQDSKN